MGPGGWFLLYAAGFAVVTALAAVARGRSGAGWLILGFLFGIFALLAVLVMNRADTPGAAGAGAPGWDSAPRWQGDAGPAPRRPGGAPQNTGAIRTYRGWLIGWDGERYTVGAARLTTMEDAERYIDAQI